MKTLLTFILLIGVCFGQSSKPILCSDINGIEEYQLTTKNDIAFFDNEPFTGAITDCFENGHLQFIMNMKNGKFHGESKTYFKNGNIEAEKKWSDGKENGVSNRFYKSGRLKINGSWVNGLKDGVWTHYDKNGIILKKEMYENGIMIHCDGDCD